MTMDINIVRAIITVLSFLTFIGIVIWAYSKDRKKSFEEAANLPFADDDIAERGKHV
jgi:cytochrome c oxidase cbb3-type subunit 4